MSQFSRRIDASSHGVRFEVRIFGLDNDRYRYSAKEHGYDAQPFASGEFTKDEAGKAGVVAYAKAKVASTLSAAAAVADSAPQTWLVIDGMPGFAHRKADLTGAVVAAYWMNFDNGIPTTVLRVTDATQQAALVRRMERSWNESGPKRKAVVTVVTDVQAAVAHHSPSDPVTLVMQAQAEAAAKDEETITAALLPAFRALGIKDTPENRAAVLALRTQNGA